MQFRDFIEGFEDRPNPWLDSRPKNQTPGLGSVARNAMTLRFGDSTTVPVAKRLTNYYGVPFPTGDEVIVLQPRTDIRGTVTMQRTGKNQFTISHANNPSVGRHARTDIPYTG